MENKVLYVKKASGDREPFSEEKIRQSIKRAKIPSKYEEMIINKIKENLYQNISTAEIYEYIEDTLETLYPAGKNKYGLKKALLAIGPTGYPFEKFVAALLTEHEYQTEINMQIWGECVQHEVDVLAKKDKRVYFVECKYHHQQGLRSDVKVALYVKARGDDIKSKLVKEEEKIEHSPWIFTNTKFSKDAITYAECMKMRLTGWSYPKKGNLQEMIESKKLYPITILSVLSKEQLQELLKQNIVLVKDILETKEYQQVLRLGKHQQEELIKECHLLYD